MGLPHRKKLPFICLLALASVVRVDVTPLGRRDGDHAWSRPPALEAQVKFCV